MYQIGEIVAYGIDGVCRIEEIAQRKFRDEFITYYVLKPIYKSTSTVFVPQNSEKLLAKLRPVLTAEQVDAVIDAMPGASPIWKENENERKLLYKDVLSSGVSLDIVGMMKALFAHQENQRAKGKKLHMTDEHYLKEGERILFDEFSVALSIAPGEVREYIEKRLAE